MGRQSSVIEVSSLLEPLIVHTPGHSLENVFTVFFTVTVSLFLQRRQPLYKLLFKAVCEVEALKSSHIVSSTNFMEHYVNHTLNKEKHTCNEAWFFFKVQ